MRSSGYGCVTFTPSRSIGVSLETFLTVLRDCHPRYLRSTGVRTFRIMYHLAKSAARERCGRLYGTVSYGTPGIHSSPVSPFRALPSRA